MATILDGVNSTATDNRAEQTSIGLTDNKSLQKIKNSSGIDVKKMTNDLNAMDEAVANRAVNNMSFRAMSSAMTNSNIQGRGQYASTYTATQGNTSIQPLIDSTKSLHMQNYMAGAEAYFNNLSAVYSSIGNLADLQVEAQLYDGQNQLQWANQALSEAEFEEEKRHTNVLLDQAEAAKAKASTSSSGSSGSSGYSSGSSSSGSYFSNNYSSGGSSSGGNIGSSGGSRTKVNVDAGANPNDNGQVTLSQSEIDAAVKDKANGQNVVVTTDGDGNDITLTGKPDEFTSSDSQQGEDDKSLWDTITFWN